MSDNILIAFIIIFFLVIGSLIFISEKKLKEDTALCAKANGIILTDSQEQRICVYKNAIIDIKR
jgi:hypothetical protein